MFKNQVRCLARVSVQSELARPKFPHPPVFQHCLGFAQVPAKLLLASRHRVPRTRRYRNL